MRPGGFAGWIPPSELRLARAGRPGQQDGIFRIDRDVLNLLDKLVEMFVARGNARLEERPRLLLLLTEA